MSWWLLRVHPALKLNTEANPCLLFCGADSAHTWNSFCQLSAMPKHNYTKGHLILGSELTVMDGPWLCFLWLPVQTHCVCKDSVTRQELYSSQKSRLAAVVLTSFCFMFLYWLYGSTIYCFITKDTDMKSFKTTIIPQGFLGQEFWQSSSWMFFASLYLDLGLHKWLGGKEFTCNSGDAGLRPGSGASPGEGNGYPLQYPCLENPMTEEAGRQQSKGSQRNGHDLVLNQHWQCWLQLLPPLEAAGSVPGAGTSRMACHLPGPPSTGCAATDRIPQERSRSSQSYDWAWKSRISLYCICLVKRICRARKNWRKKGNRFYLLIGSGIAYRQGWIWGWGGACGILVPDKGWNPCHLHWEHGVLTTGPPGKSQEGKELMVDLLENYLLPMSITSFWNWDFCLQFWQQEVSQNFWSSLICSKRWDFLLLFCCWWFAFWISMLCLALF